MKKIFNQCARLHIESITTGFLPVLGAHFLSALYQAIGKCPYSRIFVVEENSKVTGFIAGTVSIKKMYKWILIRNAFRFCLLIVPVIVRPNVVFKILETLFYALSKPDKNAHSKRTMESSAELLSVAVSSECRGKGVGSHLIEVFEDYLRAEKIHCYKVVTYSLDKQSNVYYLKNGFTLNGTFKHHGNIMNEYTKELS